jgi:uncharacterized protein
MRFAISRRLVLAAAGTWAAGAAIAQVAEPESREQALIAAAERGAVEEVERLLRDGAPVDERDARGRTALLVATIHNRVEVARLLIAAGADVNAKDHAQDSPFLYAGAEGRLDILRMTLAAGADLRSTNRYGGTALIPACHRGQVETVRELLKTAIDVDHINNLGWTALLEAIILGDGSARYVEIVRLLVDAWANPNLADRDGVGPLTHARRRGFRAIAEILEAAGAR